jgi:hypothetical protein
MASACGGAHRETSGAVAVLAVICSERTAGELDFCRGNSRLLKIETAEKQPHLRRFLFLNSE